MQSKDFIFFYYSEYAYLLVLFFILLIFSLILLTVAFTISLKSYDVEKNSPYECGFNPFEDAREPFEVQFYLVGILFIIFDLEISFLLAYVSVFRFVGFLGYSIVLFFLILLTLGFIYELYKGALDWT
jgi:NADH:ubiquinone oxidoreductase subunit 3 (subunit A)